MTVVLDDALVAADAEVIYGVWRARAHRGTEAVPRARAPARSLFNSLKAERARLPAPATGPGRTVVVLSGVLCQYPAKGLTCCFTLSARAYPSRLPVHDPGVRLAGTAGTR